MATSRKFFQDDADDTKAIGSPMMSRSRNQLGSAYAPGAFFTFEGGLGSCISLPDLSSRVDEAPIDNEAKTQIMLRLREIWQSWFERAYALNTGNRRIDPNQCLDESLLNGPIVVSFSLDQIEFVSPLKMGYAPAPLTFVCNKCHTFRSFDSAARVAANLSTLRKAKCPGRDMKGPCQWRQLDVVFVHWSGEWMPATPGRWEWNDKTGSAWLSGETCAVCGGDEFKLDSSSPRIGQWHFYCAKPSCGDKAREEWRQNDKFTTEIFKDQSGKRISERRMEPISYRASSAYYPQSDQFVLFAQKDQKLLSILEGQRQAELAAFIAGKYRFGGDELTLEEMRAILLSAGHGSEWESYDNFAKFLERAKANNDVSMQEIMERELQKLVKRWTTEEPILVPTKLELPPGILAQLGTRSVYTSRYDPFVLAVEHEALRRGKLSEPPQAGRSAFVRFNHLDNDLAPKNEDAKNAQEAETQVLMTKLGMAELGLIQEFELCKFTHGYTRVSAVPTMEKRNQQMPVRLRLFEPLRNRKRPVYVVTQENEAIYVQLSPASVYKWLQQVGIGDLPAWHPSDPVLLGGRILEVAQPFGRYFSLLHEDDASTYRYVYTLLHTYAHVLMKNIAELSGLDLGSMGEYLFPTDLAFVIYRNGTTMDLGNLSSLWRNENNRFLANLLESSTHRCNSGSLCDSSGGACPDCIMVPETSCLAQNRLLSRAVLRGGPAPREDATHKNQRTPGFLEVVFNELAS